MIKPAIAVCLPLLGGLLLPLRATAANDGGGAVDASLGCRIAVERVYDRHRIGPAENPSRKPAFDEPAMRASLRERIAGESSLRADWRSAGGPAITPDLLQAEMDRLGRETRDPALL